jgi:hypothetical protein
VGGLGNPWRWSANPCEVSPVWAGGRLVDEVWEVASCCGGRVGSSWRGFVWVATLGGVSEEVRVFGRARGKPSDNANVMEHIWVSSFEL